MGVLNLAGIGSYLATTILVAEDWRSRDDYDALLVCARTLQNVVYPQLDLQVLCGGSLGLDLGICRYCADGAVLGFLLDLLHQGSERKEVCIASISTSGMKEGQDVFVFRDQDAKETDEQFDELKIKEIAFRGPVPRRKEKMQCMDGVGGSNFDSMEWSFILPSLFSVQYVTCIDFITTTSNSGLVRKHVDSKQIDCLSFCILCIVLLPIFTRPTPMQQEKEIQNTRSRSIGNLTVWLIRRISTGHEIGFWIAGLLRR